jgi:transaldolase
MTSTTITPLRGRSRLEGVSRRGQSVWVDAPSRDLLSSGGLQALTRADHAGVDLAEIHSAASFFVSRLDGAADALLERQHSPFATSLRGRLGIAAAKLAYRHYQACFSGPRWETLYTRGARPQRPSWATMSVQDAAGRDVRYVEELIGRGTVTTLSQRTMEVFEDHGRVAETLDRDVERAALTLDDLALADIDLGQLANTLERDGIDQVAQSLDMVVTTIGTQSRAAA